MKPNHLSLSGLLALCLFFTNLTLADSVTLQNGDVLNGTIIEQNDQSLKLEHPTLGTLVILKSNIQPVTPAESVTEVEEDPADDGLLGTGFLEGWNRSLAIGLKGSEGNTENNSFHVDLNFDFTSDEQRKKFNLDYDRKTEDGEETENDLLTQMDNDYLMPGSPWFWYHRERIEWDKFEDWDYRAGGYIGPGYDFIDRATLKVRGRLGLGGNQTWGGEDDGFSPEMLIGAESNWLISDIQSLSLSNSLYPNLEDIGEYRNITRLDWKLKLSELHRGVALKFGIINEYESIAPDDTENNDLKYNLSLDIGL